MMFAACGPNGCFCTLKDDAIEQHNDNGESHGQDLQREKRGCGELIFLTSTRNDIY